MLRRAAALEPHLSEAKTNLAWALWLQDGEEKKKEAARFLQAHSAITRRLERGDVALDDSIALYERGAALRAAVRFSIGRR